MRKLGADFKTMLASEALSLCYLFELKTTGGLICRYTDSSESIRYEGVTWRAEPGMNLSAVRDTVAAFNQTATIELGYAEAGEGLTERVVRTNGLDGALFRILVIDYRDKTVGALT